MLSPQARSEGQPTRPSPSDREFPGGARRPFARFVAGGLALAMGLALPGPGRADEGAGQVGIQLTNAAPSETAQHPRRKTLMKREWGVEPLYVRQTAAGYMLEFRYKVLDPKKARPLFERQTKPVLTHVESGMKTIVPTPAKTGALRNSNPPRAGQVYWMFFANPGRLVKPGEHVNIQIGRFRADGLLVSKVGVTR